MLRERRQRIFPKYRATLLTHARFADAGSHTRNPCEFYHSRERELTRFRRDSCDKTHTRRTLLINLAQFVRIEPEQRRRRSRSVIMTHRISVPDPSVSS